MPDSRSYLSSDSLPASPTPSPTRQPHRPLFQKLAVSWQYRGHSSILVAEQPFGARRAATTMGGLELPLLSNLPLN
jgi:hypothetical protein